MSERGWLQVVSGLGDLPKLVVERVSGAVGMMYEPTHVRRMAQAKADEIRTLAQGEVDATDIRMRASLRVQSEQLRHQESIEAVTCKALPHLTDKPNPGEVTDDWIIHFFGMARDITNDQMREVWGRILAGEFNRPGSFSRRTLRSLAEMDIQDAQVFSAACRFLIHGPHDKNWLAITSPRDELYNAAGVYYGALAHLESVGLLRFDTSTQFQIEKILEKRATVTYFGQDLTVSCPNETLPIGCAMLSSSGNELSTVCETASVEGLLQHLAAYWQRFGILPTDAAS